MSDDDNRSRTGGDRTPIARRSLLGSLAVMGLAGCPGQGGESNTTPDGSGDGDGDGGSANGTGGGDGGWSSLDDPYYTRLVSELSGMGLPAGEFVYGNSEFDAMDAFSVPSDVATASALEVGDDQPFSSAVQVEVTEETEDPWSVTMLGTVSDRPVSEGDVLLGVVYLRGPESSESTPTVQFVAKDDENLSTNMVEMTPEVQPSTEWTRYYVPMQFDYSADADTWRWELFLGYGPQTVDVGGIALVDFDQQVAVDQLPSGVFEDGSTESTETDADWEAAAEERIQDHRTSDLTVEVTDGEGNFVEGADVSVAMQEHEFGFGTAVDAGHLIDETSDGDPYREHVSDLFNLAVLGNHHKWRFWEESRETGDAATEWILDQGLDLRGHVCLWANVSAWAVPPDVVSAMGREWEANGVENPELDPEYVRERTHDHIEAIIDYYGEDITEWEVVNEVIHKPGFIKAVNGVKATEETTLDDPDPVEAPILREWFQTARDAAPEGMPLGFNDYNTLTGPYESTRSQYERQIEYVSGGDAGLDFVGVQCHFNQNSALSPQQVMEGLDRYAQHDVRLRITEFDMSDEGWPEEDKAEFFRKFLKTVFSHPAVDDFVVWGLIDTLHWRDDAPFYAAGWEEKPALDEYRTLVFDQWWTEEAGATDASGAYALRGFKGEYRVGVSDEDQAITTTTEVSDGGTTVEISLDGDVDEDGGEEGEGDGEPSSPIADAGSNQTASPGETVTLDGSGSTGKNLSYEWFQMYENTSDDPAISLTGKNTATASFTGPDVDERRTLDFRLEVTDSKGRTAQDTVDVVVDSASTPTPTSTPTETATPTASPTPTETATPSPTPTGTPTAAPTDSPTATPTTTDTPSPTETSIDTSTESVPTTLTTAPAAEEDEPSSGTTAGDGPGLNIVSTVATHGGLASVAKYLIDDETEE